MPTVEELKAKAGLPVSGRKAVLIDKTHNALFEEYGKWYYRAHWRRLKHLKTGAIVPRQRNEMQRLVKESEVALSASGYKKLETRIPALRHNAPWWILRRQIGGFVLNAGCEILNTSLPHFIPKAEAGVLADYRTVVPHSHPFERDPQASLVALRTVVGEMIFERTARRHRQFHYCFSLLVSDTKRPWQRTYKINITHIFLVIKSQF